MHTCMYKATDGAGAYLADVLLRLAFCHLTFVASGPPPGLGPVGGDGEDGFVSPLVQAMTSAEWSLVESLRPALRRELAACVALLAASGGGRGGGRLQELLAELEARAATPPGAAAGPELEGALRGFADFARAAAEAAPEEGADGA